MKKKIKRKAKYALLSFYSIISFISLSAQDCPSLTLSHVKGVDDIDAGNPFSSYFINPRWFGGDSVYHEWDSCLSEFKFEEFDKTDGSRIASGELLRIPQLSHAWSARLRHSWTRFDREYQRSRDFRLVKNKLNQLHISTLYKDDGKTKTKDLDTAVIICNWILYATGDNLALSDERRKYYGRNILEKDWRDLKYAIQNQNVFRNKPGWLVQELDPLEIFKEEYYYELDYFVDIFLEDFLSYFADFNNEILLEMNPTPSCYYDEAFKDFLEIVLAPQQVKVVFEKLDDGVLAMSFGKNRDGIIVIKVDPDSWMTASNSTRWYVMYHELGHDFLNLDHGSGGRMMFNYPVKEYSWEDFFIDREIMFQSVIKKTCPNSYPYSRVSGYGRSN